jgi:hypothetical protein
MLNRRNFLKTSAAVIPMTTALNALDGDSTFSAAEVTVGSTTHLVPLPPRMPPMDSVTEPWQQKILA